MGTDASGMSALGKTSYAMSDDGAPGAQIGTPGNGNMTSANDRGIVLGYDACGYVVRGNIIGLNKDATQARGTVRHPLLFQTLIVEELSAEPLHHVRGQQLPKYC